MATLAELKTRVQTELSRDDLEDDLADTLTLHIERACEYYADETFWFNRVVVSANTTGSVQALSIPATVRRIERLTIPAEYADIRPVRLEDFERFDSTTGLPSMYCHYNDSVLLYPIPDAVYAVQFSGVAQIDAPSADGDSTVWTNEAYDLINGHVKVTLCRGVFRDPEGVKMFMGEVQDALARLRQETGRKLAVPLRAMGDSPGMSASYNVFRG